MKLYEIDQRIAELVDPDTGELLDFDAFRQLNMERQAKIESVILWYKNLVAEAKGIKEEIDSLSKRQKATQNRAEGLLGWIALALNGERFSTPRCAVSYRSSTAVIVEDENELIQWAQSSGNESCLTYKKPDISKRAVSELLLNGVDVPGAKIEYRKKASVK